MDFFQTVKMLLEGLELRYWSMDLLRHALAIRHDPEATRALSGLFDSNARYIGFLVIE
jgi:hypothetical protein